MIDFRAIMKPNTSTLLKTDLVSCWEFDETTGSIAYDAHGSNDGTNVGATVNQTSVGNLGKCYTFNGTTNYVNVGSDSALDNLAQKSLSVWININGGGESNAGRYFDKGGTSGWLFFGGYQTVSFIHGFSSNRVYGITNTGVISTTGWYHLVLTYDNSSLTNVPLLYINGVLTGWASGTYESPSGTPNDDSSYVITLGNNIATNRAFKGLMDQPTIWNRILTSSEITEIYNSGNGLAYHNW